MPGRSRYAVVLTEEERSELESRATRYTLLHKQVQRAKLILYAAEGLTNVEIGARLEINPKVVGRWRRRFCEERLDGLEDRARSGRPRRFPPPEEVAQVKAVACEPPSECAPLSRRSAADVHRLALERGICAASASTILRWLREDAIKPWRYRSWIFPTDPDFLRKASVVLDLYAGRFECRLLHPGEFVICADEKPSIQARARIHPGRPRSTATRRTLVWRPPRDELPKSAMSRAGPACGVPHADSTQWAVLPHRRDISATSSR